MPTDMLDRLQENKLRGLEELIDPWEAGAAPAGVEDQAAVIAEFFVNEAIGSRQRSLDLWEYNWALALAGKVPDRRERGAKLRSLLERGGRILALALLAVSVASVTFPAWNPWRQPWLYQWLDSQGLIPY